jgi:hypothetical protein
MEQMARISSGINLMNSMASERDSMFCLSQQTAAVSHKQIFPAPVLEAVFSIRKFQSIV